MIRSLVLASGVMIASVSLANAQAMTGRSVASNPRGGTLNEHNITSTGATVPNPGVSQSSGTTPLDVGVQRRDDAIQNSICSGC